jgi:hypothetical protein
MVPLSEISDTGAFLFPHLDPSLSTPLHPRPGLETASTLSPSFVAMSKASFFQALSYSSFSHRARFGALLGGILFLTGVFFYHVAPPRFEDFGYGPPHSPEPSPSPPPGHLIPGSDTSPPSYGSLESRLFYQEKLYKEFLEDRKRLIVKWGPTADKVKT